MRHFAAIQTLKNSTIWIVKALSKMQKFLNHSESIECLIYIDDGNSNIGKKREKKLAKYSDLQMEITSTLPSVGLKWFQ